MGKYSKKGKIEYFEPNELYGGDNHSVNLEDLSKYVNLYVKVPSRYLKTTEYKGVMGGTLYTINDDKKTQIPLLTTNYVDVSYTEIKKGNIINGELFGIESININFDAQFFPRVTINFTDVRGFGLMSEMQKGTSSTSDSIKRDLTAKSFFTSLFNFPYPTFTLEVKGYYGHRVSFDLALEEFNTEFDSLTGNFRTTVTFIGSLWGILADIPMTYLMIAPFIDRGDKDTNDYWNSLNLDNSSLTYLEFLDKYNKLLSGEDFNDTENNVREKLKNSYVKGDEIKKLETIKECYEGLIKEIKDGWKLTREDMNDEHFFILNPELSNDFKEKVFNYDTFEESNDSDNITGIIHQSRTENNCMSAVQVYDNFKNLDNFFKNNIDYRREWEINVTTDYTVYLEYFKEQFNNYSFDTDFLQYLENICVYNFKDLKAKLSDIEKAIKDNNIDEDEFNVCLSEYVSDILGFKPTINIVYDTLFKHLECFSKIFNETIKNCRTQSLSIKEISSNYITDIPTNDKHEDLSCPPFPLIAEKKDKKVEIIYPGNINLFKDRYEVKLTDSIYNTINEYVNTLTEAEQEMENNSETGIGSSIVETPNFITDLLSTSVRKNYNATHGFTGQKKAELIRDIFISRVVSYSRLHGFNNDDIINKFIENEVNLLHASNENLFAYNKELLAELDAQINGGTLRSYYGFNNDEKNCYINYFDGAKDKQDLDSSIRHNNNDSGSTFIVIASGTTDEIISYYDKYSCFNDFFGDLEDNGEDGIDYKYNKNEYIAYTTNRSALQDGKDIYLKPGTAYFIGVNMDRKNGGVTYFRQKKAFYLFNKYRFSKSGSNEFAGYSLYGCKEIETEKNNYIINLTNAQVLTIGEWVYCSEKYNIPEGNIVIPVGDIHKYDKIVIDNKDFKNFCLGEYEKFLENIEGYNENKRYLIAKNWAYKDETIDDDTVKKMWSNFLKEIRKQYNLSDSRGISSISESYDTIDKRRNELKVNIYYTLKTLFDKWYCGLNEDFFTASRMSSTMKYYNTLLKDIKNDLLFDVEKYANRIISFANGEKALDTISFMSQVAQDNNCNFISLPQYPDVEMEEIFKPHTLYSKPNDSKKGSTYMLVHNGDASHFLDDEESDYANDGFSIADYNGVTNDEFLNQAEIKAFGVTYGMQNQNLFRNISINTKNPTITDYSIANTLLIAGSTGKVNNASSASINTQSLFPVYANRTYECIVEMMGCMDIKPLMYFQLNNVPLFRGAYMITNVSHHITANDFVTTFNGTRVSKYQIPINELKILRSTYINLGKKLLNEGSNSKKGNLLSSYYSNTRDGSESKLDDIGDIEKITLHGDAYANQLDNHTIVIHKDHIENRGFKGIGYHFWISKDGEIYNGRPINKKGSHVMNGNTGNIGICFFSGNKNGQAPNIEQQKSATALIHVLLNLFENDKFNINKVYGHYELQKDKGECPHFDVGKCIRGEGVEKDCWYNDLSNDKANFNTTIESNSFTDYINEYLGRNLDNDDNYVKYVNSKFKKIYYVWSD